MFPKPKLVVKKELKQRTIFVEYADDKYSKYVVVDVFETNMVQEPEYTKIAEARINANNNKGEQIKESEPKSDKKEEQPKPIQSSLF